MATLEFLKRKLTLRDPGLVGCRRRGRWSEVDNTKADWRWIRGNAVLAVMGEKIATVTPVGEIECFVTDYPPKLIQFRGGPWNEDWLEDFYDLSLSRANNQPPVTNFSFASYEEDFTDFLTAYAYMIALETLMVDLMGWRARLIWSDPSSLAGILQTTVAALQQQVAASLPGLKSRRGLQPKSISSGRWKTPTQVTDSNWQQFTVIRA